MTPIPGGNASARQAFGLAPDEIIVDSFAGGGGASLGIEMALGRSPDIAINHDREAIALHAANHPTSKHYPEDVWKVDPVVACAGRPVGLMWLSPDCKHFSKAKGSKPVSKRVRGLAWVAVRWAKAVKPRIICLENVEEFRGWGPLHAEDHPDPKLRGKPDKSRKGRSFNMFVGRLRALGYQVEWREMRACDYGAPTSRKRFFMVARCDGQPIVWPKPTHGKGRALAWRTAAECIDWTIPCPSIFLTPSEARTVGEGIGSRIVRPLKPATMKRIARGVQRYVIDAPKPFIVGLGGRMGQSPERSVDRPYQTITSKADAAIIVPSLIDIQNASSTNGTAPADEPLRTITAYPKGGGFALAAPTLVKFRGDAGAGAPSIEDPMPTVTANSFVKRPGGAAPLGMASAVLMPVTHQGGDRGQSVDTPAPTITGAPRGELAIAVPHLVEYHSAKREGDDRTQPVDGPLPTQTTENRFALATPILVPMQHDNRATSPEEPLQTITTQGNKFNLVAPVLVPRYGEREGQAPRALSAESPMPTIVPTANGAGLVAAFMAQHNTDVIGHAMEEPVSTIVQKGCTQALVQADLFPSERGAPAAHAPAAGADPLVASSLVQFNRHCDGRSLDQPLPTVLAQGEKFAEVRAFLVAYYGNEKEGASLFDPMRTVTSRERFGLVTVNGVEYAIADIGMRMLAARELYTAQGFPPSYKIDIPYKGKPLTKTAQVRMCGNSVVPALACALVAANVGSRNDSSRPVEVAA